jgi:hypothetical protein
MTGQEYSMVHGLASGGIVVIITTLMGVATHDFMLSGGIGCMALLVCGAHFVATVDKYKGR